MEQEQPTRVGRRLAAIVAADVAGYSRLMGLDEVGTARTLREHRAVGARWRVIGFASYPTGAKVPDDSGRLHGVWSHRGCLNVVSGAS